jgi:exonuclease SbcD
MRILHTSDWHLGISLGPASRLQDHALFLSWLLEQLDVQAIDVLVIAGDIFDAMQPSAEAQNQYYRFLAQTAKTGIAHVIVVAGNHDSASRLAAPGPVLAALNVHVVGGIRADDASWDDCLIPVTDRGGALGAVVLAVPYVHEFRLGIRTTDPDPTAVRAAFAEKFLGFHTVLVDRAQARWPGVPIVATGHLTMGAATREDYPQEIHRVGTIDVLPASIYDRRICYVALGHIHRAFPVEKGRIHYSGTPVAVSLPEKRQARQVLVVDVNAGQEVRVTPLLVPCARALVEITERPSDLVESVRGLSWTEPLPPLLYLRALLDKPVSDLGQRVFAAIESHPVGRRPVQVELREIYRVDESAGPGGPTAPVLEDLSPAQVFATLCKSRGISDTEALFAAFSKLESAAEDDWAEFCAQEIG